MASRAVASGTFHRSVQTKFCCFTSTHTAGLCMSACSCNYVYKFFASCVCVCVCVCGVWCVYFPPAQPGRVPNSVEKLRGT